MRCLRKSPTKIMVNARWWNLFDIFFIILLDHFVQVFVHFVQAFFRVAWLIYVGFFLVKTIWGIFCVISFNYFWKFSRLWNLAWDFLGVWFLPPFDHPVTWNPEYLPNPPNPSTIWVDFEVRVCNLTQGFFAPRNIKSSSLGGYTTF